MSSTPLLALVARCRALCRPRSQSADGELLARFVHQRDAAAFEELLERYAPLVWGVCRRLAATESDSEDAFQATFLALIRKAGRLDARQPLGGWLHTVAVRIARKTVSHARKQVPQATVPEPATSGDIADEVGSRELFRLVDEEIERLPISLRQPLILCCLQGRTRDEAAEILGCSVTAVKSRLERGRDLLRRRLQRRGVELPAAFLVLGLTSERIRAALWAKTMQSAIYTPAPPLVALAEAGVPTVTMAKGKLILTALLLASSATGAAGSLLMTKLPEPLAKAATEPRRPQAPQSRTDRYGDPLPDGAIARLGTVRWRHGFFIHALAYSPNGKMIAAVGPGRTLTLWDAATGREIRSFPNRNLANDVAFSPDGKILATTGSPNCHLWDVATGKELRQLKGHKNPVHGLVFAPDGKTLATVGEDETARIWDVKEGKELRRFDCQQGYLGVVAYSPNGKLLATAGKDGTICIRNPATGKVDRQLKGHKEAVGKLVFSLDGKCLASSSADETIRLWDVATARQIRVFGKKLGKFNLPIAFSPDGTVLASGIDNGYIRLWDVTTGAQKRQWRAGAMVVHAIAFSPDGKTLASGAAWEGIRLWDAATGRERHPVEEHLGEIECVRFSADGVSLFSISRERRMVWWDVAKQTPRRQFTWGDRGVGISETALSADGNTLAEGSWSDEDPHKLNLWDLRTGKIRHLLGKPQKRFWAIALSPDGRLAASLGSDQVIHIWDVRAGVEIQRIAGITQNGVRLCFSPDSKALACSCGRIWEMFSGKERCRFAGRVSVFALAFSPDGKVLASGDAYDRDNRLVRLWDTSTGRELSSHRGHRGAIGAVAFSPDGKIAASGGSSTWDGYRDNSVRVWEAATGRLIRRFEGQHCCVSSLAFSPDGLTVASGAGDSTILLWDITGRHSDGRWHDKPLASRELEGIWNGLANEDAAKAYDSVWRLVAAPQQTVAFLRNKLPPMPRPDAKAVTHWIADLDSSEFAVRQKANDELSKLGDTIAPALREALQDKPSLETRRRVQQLLDQSRDWTPERLRAHRAIQALEHIGTPSAREVLQALAAGAPEARRTEEAKAALRRLQQR